MTNVLNFPAKIIRFEEIQLDLFGYSERNIGKYNFLDVYDSDQTEVVAALREFNFQAILDIRAFPTFERPQYNHRDFLNELKLMEILYIPLVYMKNIDTPYQDFKPYKNHFNQAVDRGPILVLYDKLKTSPSELESWTRLLSKRYSNLLEAHPSTFGLRKFA